MNGIRTGRLVQTVSCPEHGDNAARSHGTFLNVAHDLVRTGNPLSIYYISWNYPSAQELTNHIREPSPALGLRFLGAPGKTLRRWYGIVLVSLTGTTMGARQPTQKTIRAFPIITF